MTDYLITIALSAATWTSVVITVGVVLSVLIEWVASKWSGK